MTVLPTFRVQRQNTKLTQINIAPKSASNPQVARGGILLLTTVTDVDKIISINHLVSLSISAFIEKTRWERSG